MNAIELKSIETQYASRASYYKTREHVAVLIEEQFISLFTALRCNFVKRCSYIRIPLYN